MATLATHNGSAVRRQHNIRNPKAVSKQGHIHEGGHYEIWRDEPVKSAYVRLFGQAVNDYNNRQSRDDRKIKDYYTHVKNSKTQHPCYEMIVGVYDKTLSSETKTEILRKFYEGWDKRNPNLELIGAYLHDDEDGQTHLHLDYIPVACGYKRGMETQAGLAKAFQQQGFLQRGGQTPQMQWQARENWELECICMSYGIEIDHPQKGRGSVHLHTEAFKAKAMLEALNDKVKTMASAVSKMEKHFQRLKSDISDLECERESIERDLEVERVKAHNSMPMQELQKALLYDEIKSDRPEMFDRTGMYIPKSAPAGKTAQQQKGRSR